MSEDEAAESRAESHPEDVLAGHGDGDIIQLEPRELLSGKRGAKPLNARFEIEVATGKRGELVALAQTAAIQDMLNWLASNRSSKDQNPDPDASPGPG